MKVESQSDMGKRKEDSVVLMAIPAIRVMTELCLK